MFLSLCLVLSASLLHGQVRQPLLRLGKSELVPDTSKSESEVISASRTLRDAWELPVEVYVISRDEILENGYISLTDILKSVPGIKVSQPGSAIEGETFLMRGLFGNYHTKILIDDIPVQPSVTGGMPLGEQLPVRQAERIEIILGPSSALYGADAMAGIINIITKDYDRPVSAQADISMGSKGYENINVMIGGKIGRKKDLVEYSFFGSASFMNDTDVKYDIAGNYDPSLYDSSLNYYTAPYYKGDTFSPEFGRLPQTSRLLGLKLKFRGLSLSYLNMARRVHSSIGQHAALYSYADPENFWGGRNQRLALKYEHEWKRATNRTTVSFLNYRLDNRSSFGLIYDAGVNGKGYKYAASDDLFIENIFACQVSRAVELVGGVSYTLSGNLPKTSDLAEPFNTGLYKPFSTDVAYDDPILGGFGINPLNYSNFAAFVQAYIDIGKFSIQLSDRFDLHSIYGTTNSPRIAGIFKPGRNWNIRAAFGTAFRAPSPYYAYSSLAYPVEGGVYYDIVPNPGLQPENLISGEAGFRWKPLETVRVEIHSFYHILDKQISRSIILLDTDKYPNSMSGPLVDAYVNDAGAEARLFGLQLNFSAQDLFEPAWVDIDFHLMYSNGKEKLPNELGTLSSYRVTPPFFGQLGISVNPYNKFYLYVRNILSSSWYKRYLPLEIELLERIGYPVKVDGYYTMDLIFRYSLSRNLQAYLQIFNVFDAEYGGIGAYGSQYDLLYNPQYGRTLKLGLSFRLE